VAKHNGRVQKLRALPDGRRLISVGDDGAALVWDGGHAAVLASVNSHSAGVSYVGTSADGTRAVTGTSDRNVVVWSTDDGALVSELPAQQVRALRCVMYFACRCQVSRHPSRALLPSSAVK
jgi:WD40 repeat protein